MRECLCLFAMNHALDIWFSQGAYAYSSISISAWETIMCEGELVVCRMGHRIKHVTSQCAKVRYRFPQFDRSTCRDPDIYLRYELLQGPDIDECQHWRCKKAKAERDRAIAEESEQAWKQALHEDVLSLGEGRPRKDYRLADSLPTRPRFTMPVYPLKKRPLPQLQTIEEPTGPEDESAVEHQDQQLPLEPTQQSLRSRLPSSMDSRFQSGDEADPMGWPRVHNTSNKSISDSSTSSRKASNTSDGECSSASASESPQSYKKNSTCSSTDSNQCLPRRKPFDGAIEHGSCSVTPSQALTAEMHSAGIWWEQRVENRTVAVVNLKALELHAAKLKALLPERSSCPVLFSCLEYDYKQHRFLEGADPAAYCHRIECGHPPSASAQARSSTTA